MEPKDFRKVIDSFKAPEGVSSNPSGTVWFFRKAGAKSLGFTVDFYLETIFYNDDKELAEKVQAHILEKMNKTYTLLRFRR